MKYFGFAIGSSMFPERAWIQKSPSSAEEVKRIVGKGEMIPCLNPSHRPTIDAMRARFGIDMPIPETPPRVSLVDGDDVYVMSVRGLPRLQDRHEYTPEEIENAEFIFEQFSVLSDRQIALATQDFEYLG